MSLDVTVSYEYLCYAVTQLSEQIAKRNATIAALEKELADTEMQLARADLIIRRYEDE